MPTPNRRGKGAAAVVAPGERVAHSRPQPAARTLDVDHAGWDRALARECERHGAASGAPCWEYPRALCGAR